MGLMVFFLDIKLNLLFHLCCCDCVSVFVSLSYNFSLNNRTFFLILFLFNY